MGSKPSSAKKDVASTPAAAASANSGEPIEFYWDPVSPPSRSVHMTLKALGEKFVERKLDLFAGEHKKEEFLKVNPAGKVPAIKCGKFSMGESRAIACYVCNKYNTPASNQLYPKDPEGRANVDRLMLLSQDVLGAIMKQVNLFGVMFEGKRPDDDAMPEAAKGLAVVSEMLKGGKCSFVAGDHLTIADFFVATPFIIYDMATDEATQERFYAHEGGKQVRQWMTRVRALPYYDEVHKDATEKLGGLYRAKLNEF